MYTNKLIAGDTFPSIEVKSIEDKNTNISLIDSNYDWKAIIVYRGRHCPLCTKYLNEIENFKDSLHNLKIDLVAVSGDSKEQLSQHLEKLAISFPIYYGLTLEQMKKLGLYISHPRSEKETNHPFAEPGLFIINEQNTLQVVDISNNPFVRPSLENLISGLEWIRNNDYPIRGTYPY